MMALGEHLSGKTFNDPHSDWVRDAIGFKRPVRNRVRDNSMQGID